MKILAALLFLAGAALAQKHDMTDCPMHAQHMAMHGAAMDQTKHKQGLDARGNRTMGFDQQKTTHHFLLTHAGGAIQVTVNDKNDTQDLTMIRRHFAHIAQAFAAGDFSLPMATHDEMPPGADTMAKLKGKITYSYEQLADGARVDITTADPEALRAVHDFLRYQIKEHETGDPTEVPTH